MTGENKSGWKTAFLTTLVLLIAVLTYAVNISHQKENLSNQLTTTKDSLDKTTSSNAQSQQQCVQQAQDVFYAGAGLTPNASSNLAAATSACQVEYPTK